MLDLIRHPSDEEIVMFLDQELSSAEAESVGSHLASCTECRIRLEAARSVLNGVNDLYMSKALDTVPSATARARLQQQMMPRGGQVSRWCWPVRGEYLYRAALAAVVLAVIGLALYGGGRILTTRSSEARVSDSGIEPNPSLTPGATRPVTLSEICPAAEGDDDLDPALPSSTRDAVLHEYGIATKEPEKDYQIDYLVNPQLGGTRDIRNLWPQSYRGGLWNARAKDELEKRLHQMVCDRTIDLTLAQREIATDWVAAYKKYVHQPVPNA